jgi:hypothetical protein
LWAGLLILGAAPLVMAQAGSASPPLQILTLKWEKQIRLPRNFDPASNQTIGINPNVLSPTATAGIPANAVDLTRAATKAREDAAATDHVFPITPGRMPVFYVYSMKVRNTSTKTIQGVAWDYLFLDSGKPVGGHQILTYLKLSANKTGTFQRVMQSAPLRVVDASASKSPGAKFIEKAVIECILYTDNTVWRNPIAREGVCELLKNGRAPAGR